MFFSFLFADPIIAFLSPVVPILQFGFFRFVLASVIAILLAAHWPRIVFVKNWREGEFFGANDAATKSSKS